MMFSLTSQSGRVPLRTSFTDGGQRGGYSGRDEESDERRLFRYAEFHYGCSGPQMFIYRNYEVRTAGNPLAHAILRGAVNKHGQANPNYHYEDLIRLYDMYMERELKNPAVIIDTNHSNSGKEFREQIRISKEIMNNRIHSGDVRKLVKGLMIESYIEEGAQKVGEGIYGKSITDPCLGWADTERLIHTIAGLL
jgi:3-deoxy-7-phosphoheptulonate synthase